MPGAAEAAACPPQAFTPRVDCLQQTTETDRTEWEGCFSTVPDPPSSPDEAAALGRAVGSYSDALMLLKTVFTAVATLLTPVMQTSAIRATSNAYSTRS